MGYICQVIKVDINKALKSFDQLANQLSSKEIAKAQVSAINDTLARSKTTVYNLMKAEIGKELNISGKGIKSSISVQKARVSTMYGWVVVKGNPLPVMAFKPKVSGNGITFKVRKGEEYHIAGAFIVKVGTKKLVVAKGKYKKGSFGFRNKRKGQAPVKTKKGITAYPDLNITDMRTISLPNIFATKALQGLVGQDIEATYAKRLEYQLQRRIDKLKPA